MARQISQKEYDKRSAALLDKLQREVAPFEDTSKQAIARRKQRAKKDLLYFCTTYLPHHFDEPFEDGHDRMAASLKEWNRIIHWRGFRGTGKTTLATVGFGLQAVLYKLTHYLPVVSDTAGQAELYMLPMKVELEANERIAHDFGQQKGPQWSADELITRGNVKVEAFSWRSFKRGRKHMQWRPSVVIGDDWENLESVRNPANTDHREDALLSDAYPALDLKKDWQMLIITNKLGRNDLGDRLAKNETVLTVDIPAREDGRLEGTPVHPKTFPDKVLKSILKTIGVVRFSREYLLKIVSSEHDDFQEKWFTWSKKPVAKRKFRVMAVDPSVGATEGHDTKAIITMDLSRDLKHFDIVHAWVRHDTIRNMCLAMFAINQKFHPDEAAIEGNGFQELIKEKLINMARDDMQRMDLMTKLHMLYNSANKNTRIMRLQTPVQNQTIRFVQAGSEQQEGPLGNDIGVLVNQLLDFKSDRTDNTDDAPDAAEMAYRRLKQKAGMTYEQVEAEVL